IVGTSQSFAMRYVTVPSLSGARAAAGLVSCGGRMAATAGRAATVERKSRRFMSKAYRVTADLKISIPENGDVMLEVPGRDVRQCPDRHVMPAGRAGA